MYSFIFVIKLNSFCRIITIAHFNVYIYTCFRFRFYIVNKLLNQIDKELFFIYTLNKTVFFFRNQRQKIQHLFQILMLKHVHNSLSNQKYFKPVKTTGFPSSKILFSTEVPYILTVTSLNKSNMVGLSVFSFCFIKICFYMTEYRNSQ